MSVNHMWQVLALLAFLSAKGSANKCVSRSFGTNRIVCVCNATYCDTTPDPSPKIPQKGTYYQYVSTQDGLRLSFSKGNFGTCSALSSSTVLNIDTTKKYQTIRGFGGAFTDSTGINIKKLSSDAQDQLIRAYYDKEGSRYSFGRVPIGGTDFSTRAYSLDDYEDDVALGHFALAPEDYNYKLPFLRKARELNPEVKYVSAAWAPPKWMKTNNKVNGLFGLLRKDYYQVYAEYLLKFLEEYKKNGVDIWGISTGNEPINAIVPFDPLNNVGWLPQDMGEWVANNLGPALERSKHNGTKILALDDQRIELPWYIQSLFQNEKAKHYVSGIAVHYYSDFLVSSSVLDATHNDFPDKFILMTEASIGSDVLLPFLKVILGDWSRGQRYFLSIIDYLNNWSIGWIDWNLALDRSGGPTYTNNKLDAPIIVNPEADEFFKQPMYFAIKHFSRFIDNGSVKVSITNDNTVKATAAVTPSKEVVVALYNTSPWSQYVQLQDTNTQDSICLELEPSSMNTVIYAQ